MVVGIAHRLLRGTVLGLVLGVLLQYPAAPADAGNTKAQRSSSSHAVKQPGATKSATNAKRYGRPTAAQARKGKTNHASTTRATRKTAARPAPAPSAQPGRPLIVIDPGHGGRDPGAIGASGSQEKAVTLAAALELRRVLQATGRYRIAMTRSTDQTLSLEERLAFARSQDADLLIAIHADASPDRRARGASVYVSSGSATTRLPASRGSAGRIASALTAGTPDPSSSLLQLSMIEQLSAEVRMVATPARNARLYVLGARAIPSVLLEMGFLSNRQDESLLRQAGHRGVLVRAISDAIDDYFATIRTTRPRT